MIALLLAFIGSHIVCATTLEPVRTAEMDFNCTVGTTFALDLIESPSSGYRWEFKKLPACVKEVTPVIKETERPMGVQIVGAPVSRRVYFQATEPCKDDMILERTPPQSNSSPVATYTYHITAEAPKSTTSEPTKAE